MTTAGARDAGPGAPSAEPGAAPDRSPEQPSDDRPGQPADRSEERGGIRSWEAVRRGLASLELRPGALIAPLFLQWTAGALRMLTLVLWVPLLHTVLSGELSFGRRLRVLERFIPDSADRTTVLVTLTGAIVAAALARIGVAYLAERVTTARIAAGERELATKLIRRHLRFGQSYFDATGSARAVRMLQVLPARTARMARWLIRLAASIVELLLYAALLLFLAPLAGAVALGLLAVYYVGFRRVVEEVEARVGEDEDLEDEKAAESHHLASNFFLLRLSTPAEQALRIFREGAERRATAERRRAAMLGLLGEVRQAANVMLLLIFVLGVGFALRAQDASVVSRYLVFFFVFRRSMQSFSTLQRLPGEWKRVRRRLGEVDKVLAGMDAPVIESGDRLLEGVGEGLAFRELTFAFQGGREVLHDVSFEARRGTMTVIVGANGSGKSTLLKLVLRLYDPPPGTVLVDGTDVRAFDLDSLRGRCGYSSVEPMLADASLRENLCIGVEATDEQLRIAAARAGLMPLVESLEGGFDHRVGGGGLRLSQGQRQRVALARVYLREPDIVLLDEAMSSFDPIAEAEALAEMRRFAAGRVVLCVTHRPAAIPEDAHVVVLDAGRVVEQGRCGDLLKRDGPYRRLWTPLSPDQDSRAIASR